MPSSIPSAVKKPASPEGKPTVTVLDYGSGNVRSAVRALERAGAEVILSSKPEDVLNADGLVVPGVGAFETVMRELKAVDGIRLIGRRVAGGRPVLAICVGLQVLFEAGVEHGTEAEGMGEWPGKVELLPADVVPHMGWNTVKVPEGSKLFAGVEDERFYFVHSYGVQEWNFDVIQPRMTAPLVTWSEHGAPFIAAVENGPLCATQFHPEKSGDAGARLLRNWVDGLRGQNQQWRPRRRRLDVVHRPDGPGRPPGGRRPVLQAAAQTAVDPDQFLRPGRHVAARRLPADPPGQLTGNLVNGSGHYTPRHCRQPSTPPTNRGFEMTTATDLPVLELLPAVDVVNGQAVRLVQGEAGSETSYGTPLEAALNWQQQGAEWVHLVDLDAAFGRGSNAELLREVVGRLDIKVELSGGLRDDESLEAALDLGVARVNLGTAALENPDWTRRAIDRFGDKIAVGLDVRGTTLAGRGWTKEGGDLWEVLGRLEEAGCSRYVVTDVTKDGTLQGPNVELLRQMVEKTGKPVVASGGISSLDDLKVLRSLVPLGVEGAIVGKALYAGAFTLPEALDVAGRR